MLPRRRDSAQQEVERCVGGAAAPVRGPPAGAARGRRARKGRARRHAVRQGRPRKRDMRQQRDDQVQVRGHFWVRLF